MLDQVAEDLLPRQERDPDLLHFQTSGNVAERGGFVVVGSCGQAEADDRELKIGQ